MYTPHLTEKEAKELSLKKGKFLLTLPDDLTRVKYLEEWFGAFKNYCPLCELFLNEPQICSNDCPIFDKNDVCYESTSLWNEYNRNVIPLSGDIYPKGKEALDKLIKIVKEWEV
jgi:hypothetical protein